MAVAHKGSISMGMVLIPIGLYKTTVDKRRIEAIRVKIFCNSSIFDCKGRNY